MLHRESSKGSIWLGSWHKRDLGGSWIKIISDKFFWVSGIVLVRALFFLTF